MADGSAWGSPPPPPPQSGTPRSHLVLAGLILVGTVALIVGAAWLLLRPDGRPAVATGDPTEAEASPPPAPETPAPPSEPRPPDSEPADQSVGEPLDVTEIAQQVADIRELPLERKVRSRALSTEGLADKISQLAFEDLDEERTAADQRLLVALRLADPEFDLAETQEDLYREQVLGVYVPKERTLYVRSKGDPSPAQRMTTAHEIVHALQDQSFDLHALQKRYEDESDAALAVLSLVEGDAVLTQQLWAQEHLTPDELQDAISESSQGGDVLRNVPDYLRASLFFPYSEGAKFVAELYRNGGSQAINDAFRDPPTTSEQILHPDRYIDRDDPVDVKVGVSPGAGWRRSATYEFGEFDIRELLRPAGDDAAVTASSGWDGGHLRSWASGDATAVAAVLAFDTSEDAAEACEALPEWYAAVADGQPVDDRVYRGVGDHFAIRCDSTQVHFALSPTAEGARKLTRAG